MQKADTWRLFIAISLPESVKDQIDQAQAELRRAVPDDVRWTKRTQFHLTLKFLGDVELQRVDALKAALRGACRDFAALRLRAEGVGFFPDGRRPRVLWAGVSDSAGDLRKLQGAIESAVSNFAREAAEGTFTGHVTLGRCHRLQRPQAETLARLAQRFSRNCFGEWKADKVELIRSELLPGGARHTTLEAAPLGDRTDARRAGHE